MRKIALLLVVVVTFAACGGDGDPAGPGGGSESLSGPGSAQGLEPPSDAEPGDEPDASPDSDAQPPEAGSPPGDAEDFFPTDKRCQVEGNQTIDVPGGTLVSVDVFDVESGQKVRSIGSEQFDQILEVLAEREDLVERAGELADVLLYGNEIEVLEAAKEVRDEEAFQNRGYRVLALKYFEATRGVTPRWDADTPFPDDDRIAELSSKVSPPSKPDFTHEDWSDFLDAWSLASGLLAPLAGLTSLIVDEAAAAEVLDPWQQALSSRDLANLSFICGYLFQMDDWGALVEYWESVDHPALMSFTETVNRIHAGGDLYSSVIEYTRDGADGLSPATASWLEHLSNSIGTHIQVMQAYGVTMAGMGLIYASEDGYPFIYLTVKDGGEQMQEKLRR